MQSLKPFVEVNLLSRAEFERYQSQLAADVSSNSARDNEFFVPCSVRLI